MADEKKDLLRHLRESGVKSIKFGGPSNGSSPFVTLPDGMSYQVAEVEFFPSIPALDLDTLVPPAPDEGGEVEVVAAVPRALANILKRSSVS